NQMTDFELIDLRGLFNQKMADGQLSSEDLHYALGQQPFSCSESGRRDALCYQRSWACLVSG
ncbi:MAG: hypothetical protein KF722_15670, partial [Nitrospira sp.]|nr:hypothetical protein [Nitrospira sp.]